MVRPAHAAKRRRIRSQAALAASPRPRRRAAAAASPRTRRRATAAAIQRSTRRDASAASPRPTRRAAVAPSPRPTKRAAPVVSSRAARRAAAAASARAPRLSPPTTACTQTSEQACAGACPRHEHADMPGGGGTSATNNGRRVGRPASGEQLRGGRAGGTTVPRPQGGGDTEDAGGATAALTMARASGRAVAATATAPRP